MQTKFYALFILLFAFTTAKTFAQIPNSGFENWTTVTNCSDPASWYSLYAMLDSTGSYCAVTKSADHYPVAIGSYSARITNDTALFNHGNILGWGILSTAGMNDVPLFAVSGHPKSLCGYYKFLPQNGDTMQMDVHFYKNGVEITNGLFYSDVAVPNWTAFKVYVSDTLYASVDSARIGFGCATEPKNGHGGPRGNSVLYIDNLSFDNPVTTGIPDISQPSDISLYPNPASNTINIITYESMIGAVLTVYDISGRVISETKLSTANCQLSTSSLANGLYFIKLQNAEKEITKKFVKE